MAHQYGTPPGCGGLACWANGAVRCTDLGAFLLQGPAIYLISAHPEPTFAPIPFPDPEPQLQSQSPVAPAAIVLTSIVF